MAKSKDEFIRCSRRLSLIARVGIGDEVKLHIAHRAEEALDPFVRIGEERARRDDNLPFAVPDRSTDQAIVRELRALQTTGPDVDVRTEDAGGGDGPEGLVLANGER